MKINLFTLSITPALIVMFLAQSASAVDSVSGAKGGVRWSIVYVKTVASNRKVDESRHELVQHYTCTMKRGGKVVRTEKIVSNLRWRGGEVTNAEARKSAVDVCRMLAGNMKP